MFPTPPTLWQQFALSISVEQLMIRVKTPHVSIDTRTRTHRIIVFYEFYDRIKLKACVIFSNVLMDRLQSLAPTPQMHRRLFCHVGQTRARRPQVLVQEQPWPHQVVMTQHHPSCRAPAPCRCKGQRIFHASSGSLATVRGRKLRPICRTMPMVRVLTLLL